eukprot:TRINITY_DN26309_c0_g1_i3.p1 TRINITY_DN26309_c0_g1~~TRINITY_DN26309_c0_g1_i3.p1  ORF type:complete len:138 (-),score=4.10 TRINITY_DN26309_c0_g1_i3:29-442(-)
MKSVCSFSKKDQSNGSKKTAQNIQPTQNSTRQQINLTHKLLSGLVVPGSQQPNFSPKFTKSQISPSFQQNQIVVAAYCPVQQNEKLCQHFTLMLRILMSLTEISGNFRNSQIFSTKFHLDFDLISPPSHADPSWASF